MTNFKNALSALAANWNRIGWLYFIASVVVSVFSRSNFWLGLLSSILVGAAAFCWGAYFQESRTCTRPTESEAN